MENRRINLLFIVNSLFFGGAEKHVVTLLNSLDTSRFQLSLAYLKNENTLLPQLDLDRVSGKVFCTQTSKKIDWYSIRQLTTYIRESQTDIVVCTNSYSLLYGCLARGMTKRAPRLIEVFHSTELITLKDRLQMLFYRPFFRLSDVLVYVSNNQRDYWRSKLLRGRQDRVINNGIDTGFFLDRYTIAEKNALRKKYDFSENDYVVGICAALRPEKAHGDLLQALAYLNTIGINIKCLLIGDGPQRPKIEAQIVALDLMRDVKISGFIEDVRPSIAACNVMVLASHSETFSISALEAMALSKPMIMSAVGGATEQVIHGENGYLYERGNIPALVDTLMQMRDPKKSAQMGFQARNRVIQNFSLRKMLDAYEQLFVSVMETSAETAEAGNAA
jgi:glycosyltransferase involved in cell wall biosynthesis